MCGITALISLEPTKFEARNVKSLLEKMQQYGDASTGITAYRLNEKPLLIKDIINSTKFMKKYDKQLNEILAQEWNALILHTRQPTQGKVIIENAQPIENGKGILAHNGSVNNVEEICKTFKVKENEKYSDSWHLAQCMERYPLKAFSKSTGTIRALYLEPKTNELLIMSNSTSGIDMIYDKSRKLFICSNYKAILEAYYKRFRYYFGGIFEDESPIANGWNEVLKEELKSDEIIWIDFSNKALAKFDYRSDGGYACNTTGCD